ncbi:hypothetical protein QYE76_070031 [Lolium multiflorum]|uniref:CCHC-type domain-containing protein n=1 Tax=Lolium multiflorum TaxID=4521 RepID=A0AAD8SIW3_LOLMU|nr:hypothetical protein QYE76_070031 [Lolium multiflorum]
MVADPTFGNRCVRYAMPMIEVSLCCLPKPTGEQWLSNTKSREASKAAAGPGPSTSSRKCSAHDRRARRATRPIPGQEDMASSINFNQFLEKEKLKSNGSNFTDWFRHVRIFLNGGNLQYVLDAPLGDPPAETETDENMNKEFPELFGMLKAAEIEIKKEHQVLMVNKTTSFKKQGKSKGKFKKGGKKAATPPMKPKNGPKPDAECYYCKEKGHWKRNCSKYLGSEERPCQEEERRSTRDRATPDWYDPCLNVMIVDNNDEDPATYEEAMMSPIPTNGKKP